MPNIDHVVFSISLTANAELHVHGGANGGVSWYKRSSLIGCTRMG
jgi:hypothetical protein